MGEGLGQNSVFSSGSINKSRVVDVKPLRSLAPVFPTGQGPPSGFSPFLPFGGTQGSQASPDLNQNQHSIPQPAPLRSFRGPLVEEDTSPSMEVFKGCWVPDDEKRASPHLQWSKLAPKKNKRAHESQIDSSSLVGISQAQRDNGNREVVNLVLMTFDALRRRFCQLGDAKELNTSSIQRPDLKAGNALMSNKIRTNMS